MGTGCRTGIAGFGRYLQVDGYAGYNRLIAPGRAGPGIQLACCWAHARPKLIEITRAGPAPAPRRLPSKAWPSSAISMPSRPTSVAKFPSSALPHAKSAPLLARLDDWLCHRRARTSARSPLGEALASTVKYRDGPGRFLTEGRIEIDNNTPTQRCFGSIVGQRLGRTTTPSP